MRKILFRGFHECDNGGTDIIVGGKKKRGVWLYGNLVEDSDGNFIVQEKESRSPWSIEKVIPSTVGQFTGLTDKNGKRIFEGDIVSDGVVMYTVEFHSSAWFKRFVKDKSAYSRLHYNANCLEIIGNIFGNSDLIGGNENA